MNILTNIGICLINANASKAYLQGFLQENLIPEEIVLVNIEKSIKDEPISLTHKLRRVLSKLKHTFFNSQHSIQHTKKLQLINEFNLLKTELNRQIKNDIESNRQWKFIDFDTPIKTTLDNYNLKYVEINIKDNINSPQLVDLLKTKITSKYIIFGGGGILRKPMFETGKKFIHVHPGIIPDIRGSECLLWSALIRNKIGMTMFYMTETIDEGEIINQQEYDLPKFNISIHEDLTTMVAKYIVSHYDIYFRADCLIKKFKDENSPTNWAVEKPQKSGEFYYFQHPTLMRKSIEKLGISVID